MPRRTRRPSTTAASASTARAISTDESAGFTLRNDGGVGISGGSRRAAVAIAVCTSCAAASMLRSSAELQRDLRGAFAAGRRHRIERRNRRELFFERRRHGARHRLRACAGQRRVDRDRREVDRRQIGHRQRHVREGAEEREADRQQSGGDRAADEQCRDVHTSAPSACLPERSKCARSGYNRDLAVDDDHLADLHARHDRPLVARATDLHCALFDARFVDDDVDVRDRRGPSPIATVGTTIDSPSTGSVSAAVTNCARPQRARLIVETRAQPNRAGQSRRPRCR